MLNYYSISELKHNQYKLTYIKHLLDAKHGAIYFIYNITKSQDYLAREVVSSF